MQKPKELFKEIVITSGGGVGRSSQSAADTTDPQFASKRNSKIIHPPIESHWHPLPSLLKKDYKGFKKMLSYPIKFRDSFKLRKSQSTKKGVVEEIRDDSKDQELVNSFRQMLLQECQSQSLQGKKKKHSDYHTLLRSAAASLLDNDEFVNNILFTFLFLDDCRFLRMRDFDLMKAKEMFLNYLKWRDEYGVDLISKVKSELG